MRLTEEQAIHIADQLGMPEDMAEELKRVPLACDGCGTTIDVLAWGSGSHFCPGCSRLSGAAVHAHGTGLDDPRVAALVEAAWRVAKSGVRFDDDRIDWIEVKVNRDDWHTLRGALEGLRELPAPPQREAQERQDDHGEA